MNNIYSYVLRIDDGAAPNPFWGTCTFTICKPAIRRKAQIGDWVIGTGSKNTEYEKGKRKDTSNCLVYAMRVSDVKSLEEYDSFCESKFIEKIPVWKTGDWRKRAGDCIYHFEKGEMEPSIRKGVHDERNRKTDLSGRNALLSNQFYYFGASAIEMPSNLEVLIKRNQGHKKIEEPELIKRFEEWIIQFPLNKLLNAPQMSWVLQRHADDAECLSNCAKEQYEDELNDDEEVIC